MSVHSADLSLSDTESEKMTGEGLNIDSVVSSLDSQNMVNPSDGVVDEVSPDEKDSAPAPMLVLDTEVEEVFHYSPRPFQRDTQQCEHGGVECRRQQRATLLTQVRQHTRGKFICGGGGIHHMMSPVRKVGEHRTRSKSTKR